MMENIYKITSVVFAFFLLFNIYDIREFADSLISSMWYVLHDSGFVQASLAGATDMIDKATSLLSYLNLYGDKIVLIVQICCSIGLACSLGYIIYLWGLEPNYKSLFGTIGAEYNPDNVNDFKKRVRELVVTGVDHSIPLTRRYKQDGHFYKPYLNAHGRLIDRRFHATKPFANIRCKKPTYYELRKINDKDKISGELVVKEVFWDAYCLITRIIASSEMDATALDRLIQRMSLVRDDYNLAPCEEPEFTNSIRHAFACYQAYLLDHNYSDAAMKRMANAMGFETNAFTPFYRRLWRRALDQGDVKKINSCLKYAALCLGGLTIASCYGYVWKRIPLQYQKKSYNGPGLVARLAHVGDETVRKVAHSAINYFNPRPDIGNIDNLIDGREARLNVSISNGVHIGQPTNNSLVELAGVVAADLTRWHPVNLGTSEEWLQTRKNYSLEKKNMIRKLLDSPPRFKQDSIFLKWESYDSFKAPRVISNSDKIEVATEGPVVVAAEEQFETLPSILSGKPVNQWGKIVSDALKPYELSGDYNIVVTDHSSFEGSISPAIKDAVENPIYDQLLQNYPNLAEHLRARQVNRRYTKFAVRRDNGTTEMISYKYSNRASGDARTYQANSLTNHYLIAGLQHHFHYTAPYFVSGDDGLMAVPKNISLQQVKQYFADLGFDTKLENTEIHKSGFCGFNFDPENNNRRLCGDVVSSIIDFFTAPVKYSLRNYKNYLYDKAICMLHEYQADPTLRPALEYILSKKRHYIVRKYRTDWWDRFMLENDNETVHELLQQPCTSFEKASSIHHNNLTTAEEKLLSQCFLNAVRDIFQDQNKPGQELIEFVSSLDNERQDPRALFNRLNDVEGDDSLFTWNEQAYKNIFKFDL